MFKNSSIPLLRAAGMSMVFTALILAVSCSSEPELIEEECTSFIFDGDVLLRSQEDVDRFGLSCYTQINGRLQIGDYDSKWKTSIRTLGPLRKLTHAKEVHIIANHSLPSLAGLENLDHIENGILLYDNPIIRTLAVFEGVTDKHVAVTIHSNASLYSLTGLQGITEMHNVDIINNPSLLDLAALENVKRMSCFYMEGNQTVTSLTGLDDLENVNCVYILSNRSLTNYCALGPLFSGNPKQLAFECGNNGFDVTTEDLASGRCSLQ